MKRQHASKQQQKKEINITMLQIQGQPVHETAIYIDQYQRENEIQTDRRTIENRKKRQTYERLNIYVCMILFLDLYGKTMYIEVTSLIYGKGV